MKKFFLISIGTIIVLSIVILILNLSGPRVKVVSEAEFAKHVDNKESFVLVIGLTTCPHCDDYKSGTLSSYVNQKDALNVYFLYMDEAFSNEEQYKEFETKYGISVGPTPTTFVVKNGTVVSKKIEGNISLAELNKFVKDNI